MSGLGGAFRRPVPGAAGAGVVTVLDDDQPATQSTGTGNSLDSSGSESNQSASSFSSVEDVAA